VALKKDIETILFKKKYLYLFFLILSWILYSQTIHFDYFIFDDGLHIFNNERVQNPSLENILWYWGHSRIPVTYNIWQIISWIGGYESSSMFRVVSILLHSINSFLVFIVLGKLIPFISEKVQGEKYKEVDYIWPIFIVSVLFCVHPLSAEAIAWVSSMKHLIACAFGLLSLIFYFNTTSSENHEHRFYYRVFAFVFYLLSVISSPITLPLMILYFMSDLLILNKPTKFFILDNFAYLILILVFWKDYESAKNFSHYQYVAQSVISAQYSLFHYILKIIFPYNIQFLYPVTTEYATKFLSSGIEMFSLFLMSASILGFIVWTFLKSKLRIISCGLILFIILISPSLGLVKLKFQDISLVADRFTYFALLAPAFLLAYAIMILSQKENIRIWINQTSIATIIIFSFLTFTQAGLWHEGTSIFKNNNQAKWHSERLNVYAYQLMLDEKYEDAEKIFISLLVYREEAVYHLITLYNKWGDRDKARAFTKKIFPNLDFNKLNLPLVHWIPLAKLFISMGDYSSALRIYHEIKMNQLNVKVEQMDSLKNILDNKLSNEPYNSLLGLSEIFIYKEKWDTARNFLIYAYPFGDKKHVSNKMLLLDKVRQSFSGYKEHLKLNKDMNNSPIDNNQLIKTKKIIKKLMKKP
jgi:hypothetical protein